MAKLHEQNSDTIKTADPHPNGARRPMTDEEFAQELKGLLQSAVVLDPQKRAQRFAQATSIAEQVFGASWSAKATPVISTTSGEGGKTIQEIGARVQFEISLNDKWQPTAPEEAG